MGKKGNKRGPSEIPMPLGRPGEGRQLVFPRRLITPCTKAGTRLAGTWKSSLYESGAHWCGQLKTLGRAAELWRIMIPAGKAGTCLPAVAAFPL